jgi:hypothetical protein
MIRSGRLRIGTDVFTLTRDGWTGPEDRPAMTERMNRAFPIVSTAVGSPIGNAFAEAVAVLGAEVLEVIEDPPEPERVY